jgi:Glycosyltransferases involved in cell wall biogenesis
MPAPRLPLLIIPAHNEAASLPSLLAEIHQLDLPLDILVVDDGSKDPTSVVAKAAATRVLSLPFSLGYGGAVQAGVRWALSNGFEQCVLMDGDGQHDPISLPGLLSQLHSQNCDLILGSRFLGDSDRWIPLDRRIGMAIFGRLASFLMGQKITDPTSGYQVMSRRVMEFISGDEYPHDFPDADVLIKLHYLGCKIREVPVIMRPRAHGKSMHGGSRVFYYLYKMLFSIFVAITQRNSIVSGGRHAPLHKDPDLSFKPRRVVGDHSAGAP